MHSTSLISLVSGIAHILARSNTTDSFETKLDIQVSEVKAGKLDAFIDGINNYILKLSANLPNTALIPEDIMFYYRNGLESLHLSDCKVNISNENSEEALEDALKAGISALYGEDSAKASQLTQNPSEFVLKLDTLLKESYIRFAKNKKYAKLFDSLFSSGDHHIRMKNITANAPRETIFAILTRFVNQIVEFTDNMNKNHAEYIGQGRMALVKELCDNFKVKFETLVSQYQGTNPKLAYDFTDDLKVFVEGLLNIYYAEEVAFGADETFTLKERKAAFELILSSKVVLGILDLFVYFGEYSDHNSRDPKEFDLFLVYFYNLFFDYEKIDQLNMHDSVNVVEIGLDELIEMI